MTEEKKDFMEEVFREEKKNPVEMVAFESFPTQGQIIQVTVDLKEKLLDYYGDPLSAQIHVKAMSKVYENINEQIKKAATEHLNSLEIRKKISYKGALVTPMGFGETKITEFKPALSQRVNEIDLEIAATKRKLEELELQKNKVIEDGFRNGEATNFFKSNAKATYHKIEFRKVF